MTKLASKQKKRSKSERSYRGASAALRQEQRHESLLAAAYEVVGTKGFKAATVRAICAEAGLTQRYYYEAFSSAEDMLIQLYQHQLTVLANGMMLSLQQAEQKPAAMAQAALRSLFSQLKSDPRLGRVLFLEVFGVSEKMDEAYRQGTRRFVDIVMQISRPFYPQVEESELADDTTAVALVGGVVMVAMTWILNDYDKPEDELVQRLMFVASAMDAKLSSL